MKTIIALLLFSTLAFAASPTFDSITVTTGATLPAGTTFGGNGLSTTGGANKVPQFTSGGNLQLGTITNPTPISSEVGQLWLPDQTPIEWFKADGSYAARILVDGTHSGGPEMRFLAARLQLEQSLAVQVGSAQTARDGMYLYMRGSSATSGDTLRESRSISLNSRTWTSGADTSNDFCIQAVPLDTTGTNAALKFVANASVNATTGVATGTIPFQLEPLGARVMGGFPLIFNGSTSGTATLAAPATAGTTVLTLPSSPGTLALTSQITGTNSGTNTGDQTITLTGDVTGSGTGSFATTLATVTAAKGGTGQTSYAVGDLLYASGSTALSKLAGVATGNALISGGVTTAPSWGKITTSHTAGIAASGANQDITSIFGNISGSQIASSGPADLQIGVAVAGNVTAAALHVYDGSGQSAVDIGKVSSTSGDHTIFTVRDRSNAALLKIDPRSGVYYVNVAKFGFQQTSSATASVDIAGGGTGQATLRLRSQTAPTSPNGGDIYYDGTDTFHQSGIQATGDIKATTIGKTLSVKSGSNALAGTFTLSSGAATVSTTAVDANTTITCTVKTSSGTLGTGSPEIVITAGTGFTATSIATDNSTYNWVGVKVN